MTPLRGQGGAEDAYRQIIKREFGTASEAMAAIEKEILGAAPDQRLPARPMPEYKGQGGIYGDFLHCVRTRERPFRDIELAHRTMVVCHLGITACQLNRPLVWDPIREQFPGDEQANRFLDRARREPWSV